MVKILCYTMPMLAFSCNSQDMAIKKICVLPEILKETSAVETSQNDSILWTLMDAGNSAELYAFTREGKITRSIVISGVENNDWEDLTSDAEGNLYIGDFGNNDNTRKNLSIYKIDAADLNSNKSGVSQKTTFYYPEQKDFAPKKGSRIYDVEAFFISKGNFYLFTKNRSTNSETTMLYKIASQPGNQAARLIGKFKTCPDFNHCAITSADISPDGTKVALLSSGYVWLFTDFSNDDFFKGKVQQIDLNHFSQKEGICFSGNDKLLITDERKKKCGGNLYELDLPALKAKP